jgi:hypothetical protein
VEDVKEFAYVGVGCRYIGEHPLPSLNPDGTEGEILGGCAINARDLEPQISPRIEIEYMKRCYQRIET